MTKKKGQTGNDDMQQIKKKNNKNSMPREISISVR